VDRFSARLLGRHVGGGPEDDARLRHGGRRHRRRAQYVGGDADVARARARLARFGEAEIEHLDGAVVAHPDVGPLQIAVNDALLVRGLEGGGDLPRDRQRLVDGNWPLRDAIRKRCAVDELHHERLDGRGLLEPVDCGNVRMVERREQLGLPLKPRQALRVGGGLGRQDLDRDLALQPGVGRAIDLPHAAFAQLPEDVIRTQHRVDEHHVLAAPAPAKWLADCSGARPVICFSEYFDSNDLIYIAGRLPPPRRRPVAPSPCARRRAMRGAAARICLALALLTLRPSAVAAQSTIAGLVKDSSGGVLPGVTVEATSPVLIEKSRTVVTDSDGRYAIVDLRPGTYQVVFT